MEKKKVLAIHSRLARHYGKPRIELVYHSDFELLIAVILSAQTTDKKVNMVTPVLFSKFPDACTLAEASLAEVEEIIREIGLFRTKARNIISSSKIICKDFGGRIPADYKALISLPGVGRKSANVILSVLFGRPAITVDTHVRRLSYRIGFSDKQSPLIIEKDLMKIWPKRIWSSMSNYLILHGRYLCKARNPGCDRCPIDGLCAKRI